MKKTEVPRGTWENASFLASRSQNEHNEVPQSAANGAAESLENALDDAAVVRRRLHRAIGKRDRDLAVRVCSREYLPALQAIRESYPRETMEAELDTLLERMQRGWELDTTPSRFKTFQKLLSRYEVITDCLEGDVINRTFDRLDRVGA